MNDLEKSLLVTVKIPHYEVDRVVVTRLIGIRNSIVNRKKNMLHVDETLKIFLTEDEFQKYVINKEEIDF
jgi:hypothetical protein